MKKNVVALPENPYKPYIEASIRTAKKEKELEEQKTLDFQKWLDSERRRMDMSGLMDHCLFCEFRNEKRECICDPTICSKEAVCVKAYRKMKDTLGK